jgi:hypothetical protein
LKGTAITLREPFAVLRKRKATAKVSQVYNNNNAGGAVVSESTTSRSLRKRVRLEVVGVVKKKLMFDQYPKSIMRSHG